MKQLNKKTIERLTPELLSATILYMAEFANEDEQTAGEILWRLTYDPTGFCKEKFGYNEPVTYEQGRSIRLELADAYKEKNPNAMLAKKTTLPENLQKVAESATGNDLYAQPRMLEKLQIYAQYYDGESCARVLFLLKSEKEENNFGALRALGFNYIEADFFKTQANVWAEIFQFLAKDKIREYEEKQKAEKRKAEEEERKRKKQEEDRKKVVEPYLDFTKKFENKTGIQPTTIIQYRGDIIKLLELYDAAYGY